MKVTMIKCDGDRCPATVGESTLDSFGWVDVTAKYYDRDESQHITLHRDYCPECARKLGYKLAEETGTGADNAI